MPDNKSKCAIALPCAESFSLYDTLISGQCFRWTKCSDSSIEGIALGVRVRMIREKGMVYISGDDRSDAPMLWRHYLDLDTDYDAIRDQVTALEPRLADAADRRAGIHILNQEAWEALCSFILSQNNNIPRIRGLVEKLCALCGVPATGGGYAFPDAQAVASLSEESLAGIGCGYRVPYVLSAARCIADGTIDLEELRIMPISQARQILLGMHGIGPKVADCVLLYGLHRLECFPQDVWIRRALEGEFRDTPLLGTPYAGVAQQYIFEYIRNKND